MDLLCGPVLDSLECSEQIHHRRDFFPSQPADCLFKMTMYMQVWKPVARRQDRGEVESAIREIRQLHDTVRERP